MLEIRVRHLNDGDPIPFMKCEFGKQYEVIRDIEASGGVYFNGNYEPFHSHQYVMDKGEIFFEIIVGEEP